MKFEEILTFLINCKDINSIAIVGSSLEKPDASNTDVIILYEKNKNKILNKIEKIINNCASINEDVAQFTLENGKYLSFLIENKKKFKKRVQAIINGENGVPRICNWTIVGWLPESFIRDLSKMFIYKDKDCSLTNLKEELKSYPPKLKESIINFSNIKIANLNKIKKKIKTKLAKKICDAEIKIYTIRKQYAENDEYLNSFLKF